MRVIHCRLAQPDRNGRVIPLSASVARICDRASQNRRVGPTTVNDATIAPRLHPPARCDAGLGGVHPVSRHLHRNQIGEALRTADDPDQTTGFSAPAAEVKSLSRCARRNRLYPPPAPRVELAMEANAVQVPEPRLPRRSCGRCHGLVTPYKVLRTRGFVIDIFCSTKTAETRLRPVERLIEDGTALRTGGAPWRAWRTAATLSSSSRAQPAEQPPR